MVFFSKPLWACNNEPTAVTVDVIFKEKCIKFSISYPEFIVAHGDKYKESGGFLKSKLENEKEMYFPLRSIANSKNLELMRTYVCVPEAIARNAQITINYNQVFEKNNDSKLKSVNFCIADIVINDLMQYVTRKDDK